MKAISEHLAPGVELLRVGGDCWDDDGPYYIAVVAITKTDEIIIKGLDKPIRPSHWRAIIEWAGERDATRILFTRKRAGREFTKVVQVKRKK